MILYMHSIPMKKKDILLIARSNKSGIKSWKTLIPFRFNWESQNTTTSNGKKNLS